MGHLTQLAHGFIAGERLTNPYQISCTDRYINGSDTRGEQDRKKHSKIKTLLNRRLEYKRKLTEI